MDLGWGKSGGIRWRLGSMTASCRRYLRPNQLRWVLESAYEDLLRKTQIMGLTAFKEALRLDPIWWLSCESGPAPDATRARQNHMASFLKRLRESSVKLKRW